MAGPEASWHRFVGVAVATLLLAGCLSGGQAPSGEPVAARSDKTPQVPMPSPGDAAVYEDEDGRRLEVQMAGRAARLDAGLEIREALILSYTWWPQGTSGESFRFEGAIDPETGLVLQQTAYCGEQTWDDEDRMLCYDERATVRFSAEGLPGGLGAGPFWNTSWREPPDKVALASPYVDTRAAGYPWSALSVDGLPLPDGCRRAVVEVGDLDEVRRFTFTGGLADLTLCHGDPFPRSFISADGARFDQVPAQPSGQPPTPQDAGPWEGPRLTKAERGFPLFAAHPEWETPFPTEEAHRAALDRSRAYARLFEDGAGGILLGSHLHLTHTSQSLETRSSKTYERRLWAVDAQGEAVELRIERERSRITVGSHEETEATYRITSEEQVRWPEVPDPTSINRPQADVRTAVDFAEAASGSEIDPAVLAGVRPILRLSPWFADPHEVRLADGYTVVVFLEDPVPEDSPIVLPYELDIDGPTARPLWFDLPRDRLPFGS